METTLVFGDYVYITLIIIIFGGASGAALNNVKGLAHKVESFEKKIDKLLAQQSDGTR